MAPMAESPPPQRTLLKCMERYVLAHVASYPLAFLWAVASIPLAIHLNIRAIDRLNDDLPAIGNFVVRKLAWPAGAVFALPHLVAIPWAFGRDTARHGKPTWIAIAAIAATGVLFGAASWLWLVLR